MVALIRSVLVLMTFALAPLVIACDGDGDSTVRADETRLSDCLMESNESSPRHTSALCEGLLAVDDLSPRLVEDPPRLCDEHVTMTDCREGSDSYPTVSRRLTTRGGDARMDLHVALIQDDAAGVFDEIREASARRRACTTNYEGGYELKRTLFPVSGHPFGTDAIVWQEIREWLGAPQTIVVVVIRGGDVLSAITYWSGRLSLTTPYPVAGDALGVGVAGELGPLIEIARRKLEAILPQLN